VWPVASWSSIDYYGRWKALHYYVRDAYLPVVALPIVEDDILKVYASSDLPGDTAVSVQVRALTLEGKILSDVIQSDVMVSPDSSRMIWQGYLKTVLNGHKEEDAVVDIVFKNKAGQTLSRRIFYLVPPRKLSLPRTEVRIQIKQVNDGYELSLQSAKLAKSVYLRAAANGRFSDNYFDLLPGERRTVLFKTEQILDTPEAIFSVKHLQETYK
jgi:beta-mannosidase